MKRRSPIKYDLYLRRTSFLPKNIKPYMGKLNPKYMSKAQASAFYSWHQQKKKCYNKNDRWYEYYGGKGLNVCYSVRDFIGWWTHNLKIFKGTWPTVGRIDHDKDYCFENITLQDMADNSREAMLRNGVHLLTKKRLSKRIIMYDWKTSKKVGELPSIREAARKFQVHQRLIHYIISGKYKSSKKVPYRLGLK